jgi:hypothetical protein
MIPNFILLSIVDEHLCQFLSFSVKVNIPVLPGWCLRHVGSLSTAHTLFTACRIKHKSFICILIFNVYFKPYLFLKNLNFLYLCIGSKTSVIFRCTYTL